MAREAITVTEACAQMGVSRATFYRLEAEANNDMGTPRKSSVALSRMHVWANGGAK
jgi:predicted DNA-binding transcriptional regulator AlpA